MASIEDSFTAALAAVRSAAMTLPSSVTAVRPLTDGRLLAVQRELADARILLDSAASLVAGEIGFRSRAELGYEGLAQRSGFRSAEKLVQHTTQSTARDAAGLVSVGTIVHEAVAPEPRSRGSSPSAPRLPRARSRSRPPRPSARASADPASP